MVDQHHDDNDDVSTDDETNSLEDFMNRFSKASNHRNHIVNNNHSSPQYNYRYVDQHYVELSLNSLRACCNDRFNGIIQQYNSIDNSNKGNYRNNMGSSSFDKSYIKVRVWMMFIVIYIVYHR